MPKNFAELLSAPRPNLVLVVTCAVLAVLCVILFIEKPSDTGYGPVRRLWGPSLESGVDAATSSQQAPKRQPECLNTIVPAPGCLGDRRVWATQMGQILERAVTQLNLFDEQGQRVLCTTLTGTDADPPVVTVRQDQFYPQGYYKSVPKAQFLSGGYPIRMRVGSTDALVLKQFFCETHFHFIPMLGPWLPKNRPATVVDAGANIGLASILFSQLINFDGEVISVEANPSTLEILEENVLGLKDGVTVLGAALAPENLAGSTVNFVGQAEEYWGFRVLPDSDLKPDMMVYKVPTKSLADIKKMAKNGVIDFMKIDIEGYEKEIFSDEASWPVLCGMRCIAAEVHDWFVPGCSAALNKFLQNGCREDPFRHIANSGEYSLYCRMQVLIDDNWS